MTSISSITEARSTTTAASSSDAGSLNSIDFLQLFLVQLQNQDPFEPMTTETMNSQLCGLSQLEEQQETNTYLAELIQYQQSICNSQAVQLIGQTIVAEGNDLEKNGERISDLVIDCASACSSATITIHDENGALIKTIPDVDLAAGWNTIQWDGTNDQGETVEDGVYTYLVSATGTDGSSLESTQYASYYVGAAMNKDGEACLLTSGGKEIPYDQVIQVMES
ncbi:MAG: flagellar hook assembly protein FlgD [Thermodesulfobacteriota bacterium]